MNCSGRPIYFKQRKLDKNLQYQKRFQNFLEGQYNVFCFTALYHQGKKFCFLSLVFIWQLFLQGVSSIAVYWWCCSLV